MGLQNESGDGVVDHIPIELSPDARTAILDHLTRVGILSNHQQETFCKRVELAISFYHAQIRLADGQTPANVRKSLENLHRKLNALQGAWDTLPGSARTLLRQTGASPARVTEMLESLQLTLPAAVDGARNVKKSGQARYSLADDVARAFVDVLGIMPRTELNSPFDDILSEVLREATGNEPEYVGRLTRHAVRGLKAKQS